MELMEKTGSYLHSGKCLWFFRRRLCKIALVLPVEEINEADDNKGGKIILGFNEGKKEKNIKTIYIVLIFLCAISLKFLALK